MAKVIQIDLDNPDKAIALLKQYVSEVEDKADGLCKELAEIARDEAQNRYDSRYKSTDLVQDYIRVSDPEKIEGGYKVSATGDPVVAKDGTPGNTVIFAEFGAGRTAGVHPLAAEFGAYPTSWSIHDQKEFAHKGRWYFGQEIYGYDSQGHGLLRARRYVAIPPSRAMYLAGEKIKELLLTKAKEVFK